MTDFLDALEHELDRAARRRARRLGAGGLGRRWPERLRVLGSVAMVTVSAGVVVIVAAVVLLVGGATGARRPGATGVRPPGATPARAEASATLPVRTCAGAGRPRLSAARPSRSIETLLAGDAPTSAPARRAAVRALDVTASGAISVEASSVRTVQVPGGGRIILLAARVCPEGATRARTALLAEVASRRGPATITLGSPAEIRSGAAFRTTAVVVREGRGVRLVAMVPPGVIHVRCAETAPASQRVTAVHHLVTIPNALDASRCAMESA